MFVYRENSKIMARITIPYAVADFIDLRERGFYYVDKTGLIEQLLNNWGEVNLIIFLN